MGDVIRHRLRDLGLADPPPVVPAGMEETEGGSEDAPARRMATAPGVRFGRTHVLAVVVLALVGVAWAGWSVFAGRLTPVAAATPSAQIVTSATPALTPEPSPTASVRVHVLGAVEKPGVVTVVDGARVEDAIDAAGGLTDDARPGDLNLAAPVPDGAQVVIGDAEDPGGEVRSASVTSGGSAASSAGSTAGLVNLNTATQAELEELPGVGPVTASAIISWREANGPFTAIGQLEEVDGIGSATRARLEPLVEV